MTKIFAKIKDTIKSIISKLFLKDKVNAKTFLKEHADELEFIIKYYPVFVKLVDSVSDREIDNLNRRAPCKYRVKGEQPFRVTCSLKINGTAEKQICECDQCSVRE